MAKLMLVEDDAPLRIGLRLALEDEGHVVVEAADGEDAVNAFDASGVELVLLDVRLPGMSGFEVCRELRKRSLVPIVMVTAQDDTHDMVAGLEAGADDYVTKPVSAKALAARVRAHLRRANWTGHGEPAAVAVVGTGLDIREAQGLVLKHGERLSLTKTEFHLLCEFARHPNQVMSRDQLLESVWGYDYVGDGRLVDTHIRRLRTKIEDDPEHPQVLKTIRGQGYMFVTADRAGHKS